MECVSTDIQYFANNRQSPRIGTGPTGSKPTIPKSVLLFPPVNNYRRFLIHKLCDEYSSDLSHFSIGHGDDRRTVICFVSDLLESGLVPGPSKTPAMGIDRYYTPTSVSSKDAVEKKATKVMPSVGIYRPPAARRLSSEEASVANVTTEKAKSKPRRPDIQVYVPRAKRASAGPHADSQASAASNRRHSANVPSPGQAAKLSNSKQELKQAVCESSLNANIGRPIFNAISPVPIISEGIAPIHSQPVPDVSVSHRLIFGETALNENQDRIMHTTSLQSKEDDDVICMEPKELLLTEWHSIHQGHGNKPIVLTQDLYSYKDNVEICESDSYTDVKSENLILKAEKFLDSKVSNSVEPSEAKEADIICHENSESVNSELEESIQAEKSDQTVDIECCQINNISVPENVLNWGNREQNDNLVDTSGPVDIIATSERLQKNDEDEEKCRISEEQNRKNRSIHRGNIYMSDILLISDRVLPSPSLPSATETNTHRDMPQGKQTRLQTEINNSPTDQALNNSSSVRLNPDECTWDMMFDENGDCLDPFLMDELTSKVGNVTIKTPQSDYKSYTTQDFHPRDEFSHVVEIYDFPAEFKTQDLIAVFSSYQSKGFEIKWVDDTHALAVFSNAAIASEVVQDSHPFLKTRPLHEATPKSLMKARRSSEFLLPYRARPETCPAMARRMVTGALGVRLSTAKQERDAERALLKLAREKKKLEARQKDEAWEGTLGGTVSSTTD